MRLVVVLGAMPQIDAALRERGITPQFVGSYRITSAAVLEAAVEAAGRSRTAAEQFLSRVRGLTGVLAEGRGCWAHDGCRQHH